MNNDNDTIFVKITGDNRKTVRTPKQLYKELTISNPGMMKYKLISKVLIVFKCAYEKNIEILKEFEGLETIPIKISTEDFKILKILKFETDATYTNIMASAILYYLEENERGGGENK